MSIWTRIIDAIKALPVGASLLALFERRPERSVGFTIAVVALGAKMAKADGRVTRDEVRAFRDVFQIAPADEAAAARVYNLARQDVAGFESYAQQIKTLFGDDHAVYEDLMEGLFHIAVADGSFHSQEEAFLRRVGGIFGLTERCLQSLISRFAPDAPDDPYAVLGIASDADLTTARAAWRRLVRETHPDQAMARGLPEEAVKLAQARLVAINEAWENISKMAA